MKVFHSFYIAALCFAVADASIPAAFLGVGSLSAGGLIGGAAISAIGAIIKSILKANNKDRYVRVTNTMGKNVVVTANCASGDDTIAEQKLNDGEGFAWKFKERIDGRTLFWCHVSTSNGKSNHWDVYKGHWGDQNWFLRGDGIYYAKADGSELTKDHGW